MNYDGLQPVSDRVTRLKERNGEEGKTSGRSSSRTEPLTGSPSQTDIPISFRVMVDVVRFDVSLGGTALLDADWAVYGNNKEIALMRKSSVSEKVKGTDFTDVAAAMSKATEDLSRDC